MKKFGVLKGLVVLALALGLSLNVCAAPGPDAVIKDVTNKLFAMVKQDKKSFADSPEKHFDQVYGLLEGAVDFDYIAKHVMDETYWNQATPDERVAFTRVFTQSLVRTYGKGIVNFVDYDTTVELSKMSPEGDKAWVIQSVKRPEKVSKVAYLMMQKDGNWKAVNVVLEGSRLMETFRSQFAGSMERNKSIAATIESWGKES